MMKKSFIFLLALCLTASFIWVNCNPFGSGSQKIIESYILDELDGPDEVKATPPEQPDIYIPAALMTFKNTIDTNLTAETVIVTEVAGGDPKANYKLTLYWLGNSGTQADGCAYGTNFNVYATETSVQVVKESISVHYYIGGNGTGAMFFDGLAKYLERKNGTAPKQEDVILFMYKISIRHSYTNVEIVFREFNTTEYWVIYKTSAGCDILSRTDYIAKVNEYISVLKTKVNLRYKITYDSTDTSAAAARLRFAASSPTGYLIGPSTDTVDGPHPSFAWVILYNGKVDFDYYNPSSYYIQELRFHFQGISEEVDGNMLYDGLVGCLKYYNDLSTLDMSYEIFILATQIKVTKVDAATKAIYFTDPKGKKWVIVYISGTYGDTVSQLKEDNG
jgi:hypothetical protein